MGKSLRFVRSSEFDPRTEQTTLTLNCGHRLRNVTRTQALAHRVRCRECDRLNYLDAEEARKKSTA